MLYKIKQDKWKHFFVGIAMGLLFEFLLLRFLPGHRLSGSLLVLFLIMSISYGFEVLSLVLKKGHYEVMDAVAGTIGGIVGMAVIIAAHAFIGV